MLEQENKEFEMKRAKQIQDLQIKHEKQRKELEAYHEFRNQTLAKKRLEETQAATLLHQQEREKYEKDFQTELIDFLQFYEDRRINLLENQEATLQILT